MKILEVRDGFIRFEADESIQLSSFIKIDGIEKSYIAQTIQLKKVGNVSIAYAKILFLYDGTMKPYDRTLPSADSQIMEFTYDILENSIDIKEPVIVGKTLGQDVNIAVDAEAFNKKMLISIDNPLETNIVIRNLVKQFGNINKKVIIIDSLGNINAKKYVAGIDFKLPLNTSSLAFLYNDCLGDATSDSKSLIIEIFKDLAEYSKLVPFVPFGALKTIIDNMVEKEHVFKLLVLKNKLAKLEKLGYFAKDLNDANKIKSILNSKCSVIDVSKIEPAFQNHFISYVYDSLREIENVQVFLQLSNTVNKKNLKYALSNGSVSTAFVTHSNFKYLNDIKNYFDNFIISPSVTNNRIFNVFTVFLQSMRKGTYLTAGEAVNYIPLISQFKVIEDFISTKEEFVSPEIESFEEENKEIESQDEVAQAEEFTDDENLEQSEISDAINDIDSNEQFEVNDSAEQVEVSDEIEDNTYISDITETSIEDDGLEDEEHPTIDEAQIIATIDEKSAAVIEEVAVNLTQPKNLFSDDEDGLEEENDIVIEDSFEEVAEESMDEIIDSSEPDIYEMENDSIIEQEMEQETFYNSDEILEDLDANNALEEENEEELLDDELILETQDADIQIDTEEVLDDNDVELQTISELNEEFEQNTVEDIESTEEYEDIALSELGDIEENNAAISELEMDNELSIEDEILISEPSEEMTEDLEIAPEIIETEFDISEEFGQQNEIQDEEFDSNDLYEIPQDATDDIESEILVTDLKDDIGELEELDPADATENDIVIDISDELENEIADDEQIVKDVDKVFNTIKEDDLSDSDLDFIDELNNDDTGILEEQNDEESILEELSSLEEEDNEGVLEELSTPDEPIGIDAHNDNEEILQTKNSSTPIVPVYDADIPPEDIVMSDDIQQGDSVVHAKYGNGVVEKMIKYGNKTLFSINFDSLGRRLLDPTLTEIKKAGG